MTFEQAAALRTLAGVANIEVRRYGLPTAGWLTALDAAGIDRNGFVKALMAANGGKMAEALKGNTIFAPAVTDAVGALRSEPGASAANFSVQVLSALASGAEVGPAGAALANAAGGAASDRVAALRKVALDTEIVRGPKNFLHHTHHKLLLADGWRFIMGGRNLADAYQCTAPAQGRAFQDTDLLARDGRVGGRGYQDTFQKTLG